MKIINEILSWIGTILFSVIIALLIIIFLFQPTMVNGPSMQNTLQNGDKIVINKTQNIFHKKPNYKDIVIIDSRVDRKRTFLDNVTDPLKYNLIAMKLTGNQDEIFWVKRVIGRPGDVLEFKDNKVIRNGEVLDEPYIKEQSYQYEELEKVTVPDNAFFVMGDNRRDSKDSRIIGCVPFDHVIGKFAFKMGF